MDRAPVVMVELPAHVPIEISQLAGEPVVNVGGAQDGHSQGDISSTQSGLLHLHEVVRSSGKHNFEGAKIPLVTKVNIDHLEEALDNYEDKQIVDFCKFGWPIGIVSDKFSHRPPPRNHRSASDYPDQLDSYVERELKEGTLLGPFHSNPFTSSAVFSPLASTEKRDSVERRVLMNCSYPVGDSVNDKIPKDSYLGEECQLRYPTVDALVALVKKKGKGCALMKRDLRRAYKQILVDPGDWPYLGLSWNGEFFFDMTMPMGLRSSARCCQRITNAVRYMVQQKGFDLVAFLDDMGTAEFWEKANECHATMGQVLSDAGFDENRQKGVSPTVTMLFLGVLFDTLNLTLSVSEERLRETMELLETWLGKAHMTRKDVEQIAGKLGFIASCVRPGRLFISRILEFMRGLPNVGSFPVTEWLRKDLHWWRVFLPQYNGVSMMAMENWSHPDEVVACDACLDGCGAWFPGKLQYFHMQFPEYVLALSLSINALELLTIVVTAKVWGKSWRGQRIVVHCDNQVSVMVMNTGRCHNKFLQACLRELEFLAARHEFEIRGNHIPGITNRIPDALSRWHIGPQYENQFLELVGDLNVNEVFVYDKLFEFAHDW